MGREVLLHGNVDIDGLRNTLNEVKRTIAGMESVDISLLENYREDLVGYSGRITQADSSSFSVTVADVKAKLRETNDEISDLIEEMKRSLPLLESGIASIKISSTGVYKSEGGSGEYGFW